VPFLTITACAELDRIPEHLIVVAEAMSARVAKMTPRFGAQVTIVEKQRG